MLDTQDYWTNVNLSRKHRLYSQPGAPAGSESSFGVTLQAWSAPGLERPPAQRAIKAHPYRECKVGESFGPSWSTHWFRLAIAIPPAWRGCEVHLLWDSNSEAMVYENGVPAQGL